MVRIPEETVDDIRQNTDIVDIISQYLQLRKSGQNHFAHCPFHEDKTPSFSVNDQKQIFYCFSCGRGGNVFNFLREVEGLSYPEAIIKTAGLINYPLDPTLISGVERQQLDTDSPIGRLFTVNKLSKKFYHHILMNTQIGEKALQYLLDRGLTKDTLEKFEIGFSPPQRNALYLYLNSQEDYDYDSETYKKSGLFVENKNPNKSEFIDRFSNRIIFPIHNEQGNAIGFSGRIFETEDSTNDNFVNAKYLNTPETELFNKRKILYNFDKARPAIKRENEVIFFEGFMDVISAWQAGVSNGIASMGTSLTEEQIQGIHRYTDHITLAFDGDDAGKEAIKRSIDYLTNKTHFNIEVVTFPKGLDPDDYIQKNGEKQFIEFLKHGKDTHISFLMHFYRSDKNLQNETEKIAYIEKVLKILTAVDSLVEREIYLTQLSDEFEISLDTLKLQFETIMSDVQTRQLNNLKKKREQDRFEIPTSQITYLNQKKYGVVERAERMLLNRLFYFDEAWLILNRITPNFHFQSEEYQLIYILFESYREQNIDNLNTEGFLDYLQEDHLKKEVAEIFLIELGDLKEDELRDYVHVIQNISPVKSQLLEKQEELKEAKQQGNKQKQTELVIEIINLNKKLKNS